MSRRFYLSLLGVVAWSTTATDTVFSILDAASLSVARVSFVGLAIAASALDVVSLCCLGLFSIQFAWRRDRTAQWSLRARRTLAACCVLPSAMALIVSLISIITIKTRSVEVTPATSKAAVSNWTGHIVAQILIWVLACLTQIILYSSPLWSAPKLELQRSVSLSGPRDSVMSEVRNSNQTSNLFMLETTLPTSPLAALPSPTFSARSSQSLRSWRDSLQHVVRPVTSRTKLINGSSLNKDARSIYSDGHSIDNVSQVDGFDAWDTSGVDPRAREAVLLSAKDAALQSAPSRGTALEPIPGSRPASPARALDGPFPLTSDGRESPALTPPPKMVYDTSRPPSPVVSEAHIHPLFRTESPTPAPPMTSGTSIVASPLATQMIPCPPRPYSRMRSNSRAASPSPLLHSRSLHDGTASPRRSPSPPSREMTPPIPDFVLNNSPSPRSSFGAKRKNTA
ncbi:hypothetical protein K505DRAFT_244212 [Melanomma pulvis-pyrius CBS 109.77]|uniref:Uncharacterized protein n=1 Tax=Melanomma pulvis-pyrius CBS 109.77 TaxID=1314802 RepID=A0A6A6XC89_9PLEO|nr:hypothetical protein K505DRAFT_244212 [Melanomma pulvis-pyrius CBS 109.77]